MSEKFKKKSQAAHLSPVANVLQSLFQSSKSPLSQQFIRWRLWNEWENVVGCEIAQHSMPVGYLDGALYVWVKSAARMQEMQFVVRPLMQKINQFAGSAYVRSIRFTLDRKAVPMPQENAEDLRGFLSKPPPNEDGEPPLDR
jgi:predicted nucleic acid-binding Zn ribbon protein